ncbi:HpcH/HpaI aldolase/citrate lyase family protein [Streptomyces mirabilis]|uniref:HpcH/HpaI aldolase/citrate lyase family protein n=1 Tax=Streptomyces mirabilis TaxID=68239 RepID=UPI0033CC118B
MIPAVRIADARSFLFVPGSRPDRFAKAQNSHADIVILDLEDAVAPQDKSDARAAVVGWLAKHPAVVRINAVGTPWHQEDLAALNAAEHLLGVMLPKAESSDEVYATSVALHGVPLLALVETAKGIRDAAQVAETVGVVRLAFGSYDFCRDAGVTNSSGDERELLLARSTLVIASRAAGLPGPVDGVQGDIADESGLLASTRRAADLGFTAKLCIHPAQLHSVHEALRPGEEELAWARRVLQVAGDSAGAAVRVDGQMIDKPRLDLARRLLALDRAHNRDDGAEQTTAPAQQTHGDKTSSGDAM